MIHKIAFLLCTFYLSVSLAFSQKSDTVKGTMPASTTPLGNTNCDCKTAITINLLKKFKYGLTNAPNGFGSVMEIKAKNKSDKSAFEQEHNTAWYLLNINRDGELTLDIIPQDSTNDYDFLLYNYTGSHFCEDLVAKKITPIRGNLSRNNLRTNGATGLSSLTQNNFSEKGQGDNYSHSIQVKKGEKYMLVLDNVYPNGKGHALYFNYLVQINIKGTVVNFAKQAITVEVTLMDEKNNLIAKTTSDPKTGNYKLTTSVKENAFYSAIYYNSSYFPESAYINTRLLKQNENTFTIDKTMAGLKVGGTYSLMYYKEHDQGFFLYEEWPPFYLLSMLMKNNPTMKIRIEIHTLEDEKKAWNKIGAKEKFSLTEWRVINFNNELLNKGISTERMEIVPSDKAIISNPKTEEDRKQNRQVSITILSK